MLDEVEVETISLLLTASAMKLDKFLSEAQEVLLDTVK
jgi:hypothetical protein